MNTSRRRSANALAALFAVKMDGGLFDREDLSGIKIVFRKNVTFGAAHHATLIQLINAYLKSSTRPFIDREGLDTMRTIVELRSVFLNGKSILGEAILVKPSMYWSSKLSQALVDRCAELTAALGTENAVSRWMDVLTVMSVHAYSELMLVKNKYIYQF